MKKKLTIRRKMAYRLRVPLLYQPISLHVITFNYVLRTRAFHENVRQRVNVIKTVETKKGFFPTAA